MDAGSIVQGKYQIIEKVGKGAFSNWYKANQLREDGTVDEDLPVVALKIAQKPEFSFYNEYTVNHELSTHNRILKYKDYGILTTDTECEGKTQEVEYLVSDYMPNGDLFSYVNNEGFDEDWARFLFRHVLKGIESLHKDGYAHMDIKLGNILIDGNYLPKLADYGFIQRLTKDDVLQSKDFKWKGTRHYICPEVNEESSFSGKSADIFALGVTFFVLMVGDYPFSTANRSDSKYQNLYKKDTSIFWKKHSRAKKRI